MNKILLTGATGFIGQALLPILRDRNKMVYVLVRKNSEKNSVLKDFSNVQVIECSMSEYERLPQLINDEIDTCIHLAWEGSTGNARADYELQLENCDATLRLVDALAQMNVKRFVGVGTLAEMDVLNYHMDAGATPNAVSIYGIAKLNAHLMSKAECTKHGMEHIWCRLSNVYGEGNETGNFINMACKKFLSGERAAFTEGMQYYDFVHIDDAVAALYALSCDGKKNTCYYVGSGNPKRLREFIIEMRDVVSPDAELFLGEIPFNGKSLDMEDYSIETMKDDTGFCPKITFREGMERVARWLKQKN